MKDGRTHLAHKQEHAVDMDTGAIVAITLQDATAGDTATIEGTVEAAEKNLADAREKAGDKSKRKHEPEEVVADKGYHSKAVMLALEWLGLRSCPSAIDSVGMGRTRSERPSTQIDDERTAREADD